MKIFSKFHAQFWNLYNKTAYGFQTTQRTLLISYLQSFRHSSRTPRWFRLKKKPYDIVCLGEVGTRRKVPDFIIKPNYAESGIAEEVDDIPEILNECQIKHMRQSCALAKLILDEVAKYISVGVTTDELDAVAHTTCIGYEAYPSPLNYRGYPKSICTSVNNIACHGIPDNRKLKNGDIISVDVSIFYNGYHGDCASTYCVGDVSPNGCNLVHIAEACLDAAVRICHPHQNFREIGKTISNFVRREGYSVVPAFCGHGIGSYFHGPPQVLHYENDNEGQMLKGMVFTIEPVISEGSPDIVILEDGWTAASEDDSRSAQFEHTILVTENGAEILTDSSAFLHSK